MNELKPCPFGHKADGRAKVFINDDLMPQGFTVGCCGCGAQIGYYADAEDAVGAWNTRSPTDAELVKRNRED